MLKAAFETLEQNVVLASSERCLNEVKQKVIAMDDL